MPLAAMSPVAALAGFSTAPSWASTGYGPATLGQTGGYGTGAAANALSQGQQYAMNLPSQVGQANLQALNYDQQLAATANATNQLAQIAANQARLGPQGQQLQNQIMQNAMAGAQGEITPSELRTFQDISAQQWGGRGFGVDNPAAYSDVMNRYLRTQYQREQDAANTLQQLYAENPSAPITRLEDFYLTPGQFSSSALAAANLLNPPLTTGGTPRGGGGGGDGVNVLLPGGGVDLNAGGGYPGAGFSGAPALPAVPGNVTLTGNTIGAGPVTQEDIGNLMGDVFGDWYLPLEEPRMTGEEWSYLSDIGYPG